MRKKPTSGKDTSDAEKNRRKDDLKGSETLSNVSLVVSIIVLAVQLLLLYLRTRV